MTTPPPCPKCRVGHLALTDKRGPSGARVWECSECPNRVLAQGLTARLRDRYRGWVRGLRG